MATPDYALVSEFQVALEFEIPGRARDEELLVRLAEELEATVPKYGPSSAIHGGLYGVSLIVDESHALAAAARAVEAVNAATGRVLGSPTIDLTRMEIERVDV